MHKYSLCYEVPIHVSWIGRSTCGLVHVFRGLSTWNTAPKEIREEGKKKWSRPDVSLFPTMVGPLPRNILSFPNAQSGEACKMSSPWHSNIDNANSQLILVWANQACQLEKARVPVPSRAQFPLRPSCHDLVPVIWLATRLRILSIDADRSSIH